MKFQMITRTFLTRVWWAVSLRSALITLLTARPPALHAADVAVPDSDVALQPAHVIVNPWPQHIPPTRRQGVPGIERTAKGRLWAVYGRDVESTRNYQVLKTSDDDGRS